MTNWHRLAPYIRGLSRSRFGLHVFAVDFPEGEIGKTGPSVLVMPPYRDDEGYLNELESRFHDATSMEGESRRVPGAITIEGDGVFGLGRNIEEAERNGSSVRSGVAPPAVVIEPLGESLHESRSEVVSGSISVVTGGAQGFGAEISRHLAEAGSTVFIADLNEEGARRYSDELNKAAGKIVAIPIGADVSDEASVAALFDTVLARAGGLDIFVSNAGVLKAGSVKDLPLEAFDLLTRVNYVGYFLGVKYASQLMATQHRGDPEYFTDIIQINSKSGLEGSSKNSAYAGGKFGGIGLTQSFAIELIGDGIKVNSICPGNFFEGPLWSDPEKGLFVQYLDAGKVPGATSVEEVRAAYEAKVPMGRGCTGRDVIRAIYYIVEQKYETGQAVPVTGGQVMLK